MKDSINHAILITGLLERDIERISASGTGAQQIIAAKCAELRTAMANHLRYIQNLGEKEADGSFAAYVDHHAAKYESEQSFKAGDFNGDDLKRGILNIDLPTENLPAGKYRLEINVEKGNPLYTGDLTITDDTYMRHAAVSDAKALAEYQQRVRRLGSIIAGIVAISAGVILAGIKIWFTYFRP